MGAGRLSYSQARAISRIVKPDEHALVDDLIEAARHGTVAQLEVLLRGLRTVDHNENPTGPAEYLNRSWTSDSRWRLSARLDPERGAIVDAAVEAIAHGEGISPVDALVRLAEIGLATLADAENPPRSLRGDERAAVVMHIDAARVRAPRSAERGTPSARVASGPGLPDRVVERLIGAGRVRTVVTEGGSNVLDVGRSHRLVTDRQYRALLLRHHGHCGHPKLPQHQESACPHRIHWLHGGRTDLDNLLLLCERHHTAHHDGQFEIFTLGGGGRFRFVSSGGRDLSAPIRGVASRDMSPFEDDQTDVASDSATSRWDGQRLDRRYAISVLAQRRQVAS